MTLEKVSSVSPLRDTSIVKKRRDIFSTLLSNYLAERLKPNDELRRIRIFQSTTRRDAAERHPARRRTKATLRRHAHWPDAHAGAELL